MNFARSILIAMTAIAALTSVPTGRAQAAGFDGTWSNGAVSVFVSRGNQRADGVGRLSASGGGGKWKSAKGECSGRWTAERRG